MKIEEKVTIKETNVVISPEKYDYFDIILNFMDYEYARSALITLPSGAKLVIKSNPMLDTIEITTHPEKGD